MTAVAAKVARFEPQRRLLSLARSLLALAQLSELLGTRQNVLFLDPPGAGRGTRCSGVESISLWCATSGVTHTYTLGTVIAIAVLVAVAVGYSPRHTCVPHWYVAFSISVDVTVTNGGDGVAEITTMLLIAICLGDRRTWAWQDPRVRPVEAAWRGSAYAAHLVLRVQITVIYANAALAKLLHPAWRHGFAVRLLVEDPAFGPAMGVRDFADRILAVPLVTPTLTYGVIGMEIAIAISMWFGGPGRRRGLALACLLHGAIIVVMGLFSFGLIMISLLAAAAAGAVVADAAHHPKKRIDDATCDLRVPAEPAF